MTGRPWDAPLAKEPAPWMADAACAEIPVERLDFMKPRPLGHHSPPGWREHLEACADVCRSCLVLPECRSFGRRHGMTQGVWGGVVFMTLGKRRDLVAA